MTINVLLAEDENAWLFINILAMYNGFDFVRADDGRQFVTRGDQAVALARTARPDIILMDLRLPVMSGLEAIRCIREFDPEVPIIAFTAFTDRQTRQQTLATGANDFFTKPPDYRRLYEMIVSLVAARPRSVSVETDQEIIAGKQRRLAELKLKQAQYGLETPVHILTEIADLAADLAQRCKA